MSIDPNAINPHQDEADIDPNFVVTDDEDEDELDEDDLDDVTSSFRDYIGPKRVPNGVYDVVVAGIKYTELPRNEGRPYATLNLVVTKGPYKGKRIPVHLNA